MLILTNIAIIISTILISIKYFVSTNSYERIISFYLLFLSLTLLIIINSIIDFNTILDVAIILFLLGFTAILFLTKRKK